MMAAGLRGLISLFCCGMGQCSRHCPPQEWQQSVRSAISGGIPSPSLCYYLLSLFLSFSLFSCRPIWEKCAGPEIFCHSRFLRMRRAAGGGGKLERVGGVFLKVGGGVGGVLNPHVVLLPTPLSHLSGLISSFTLPLSGGSVGGRAVKIRPLYSSSYFYVNSQRSPHPFSLLLLQFIFREGRRKT